MYADDERLVNEHCDDHGRSKHDASPDAPSRNATLRWE
jgi:hypothetical protein